uniref:Ubiquitin-like protein 3 n=1 Tax=Gasterosteus aculeatus aculeatus TaxID=481459 RepID=A0AAQ4RQE6_GASAC
MTGSSTPADMINLRLILVSGKTKEFLFSPNDSAADIAKHVYDNWPMDWEEEQVSSPNILRLIYQGRFLHGNVTLGALKLPLGRTTVMHLVARETLPEPNSQGNHPVFPFSGPFHTLSNVLLPDTMYPHTGTATALHVYP